MCEIHGTLIDSLITMEPSYVLSVCIGMLVTVSSSILILYVNAQVGLYYMKLQHGQYVVREMMHNPVSFIEVGPQVCSTAADISDVSKNEFHTPGAVTKRLNHCACQFPWYVKIMMRITQKQGDSQLSHSRAGKRENRIIHDTQCVVNP